MVSNHTSSSLYRTHSISFSVKIIWRESIFLVLLSLEVLASIYFLTLLLLVAFCLFIVVRHELSVSLEISRAQAEQVVSVKKKKKRITVNNDLFVYNWF